jgi:hypothetical protein
VSITSNSVSASGLTWRMAQTLAQIADGSKLIQPVGTTRALERRGLIEHKSGPFSVFRLTEAGYRAINREPPK